jgi:alpha-D-ribose 1-methylphosphonate 5-triphosphate diphosphatase
MHITIANGRVLRPDSTIATGDLAIADGRIVEGTDGERLDARNLLVLPGLVDIHGDAFERQVMPRAGVHFPLDLALADTDRQLAANGITTAFHGLTWSWEPGLRGREAAYAFADALDRMRPHLGADHRLHLRWETYNLDVADEVAEWLASGRVDLLAFNDHFPDDYRKRHDPKAMRKLLERTGLDQAGLVALIESLADRAEAVPGVIARLAGLAREHGIGLLSHDDISPAARQIHHDLGCTIAEFPKTQDTAETARALGDAIVFGAPNVVRGKSHTGLVGAAQMVEAGLCTVLASDYYYPAMLGAAFRLARDGIRPLEHAWDLVAGGPARAAGLADRGQLAPGLRADLLLVDDAGPLPRVMATMSAGRWIYRTSP